MQRKRRWEELLKSVSTMEFFFGGRTLQSKCRNSYKPPSCWSATFCSRPAQSSCSDTTGITCRMNGAWVSSTYLYNSNIGTAIGNAEKNSWYTFYLFEELCTKQLRIPSSSLAYVQLSFKIVQDFLCKIFYSMDKHERQHYRWQLPTRPNERHRKKAIK